MVMVVVLLLPFRLRCKWILLRFFSMSKFQLSCSDGSLNHQYFINNLFMLFRFLFRNRKVFRLIKIYYPYND